MTSTAQLDAYAETHWQEIARIARGEIAGIAEATAMLGGQPDTALIEFAVTSQGTVIFLAGGGDTPFNLGTAQAPAHPPDISICPTRRTPTTPDTGTLSGAMHCPQLLNSPMAS